MAGRVSRADAVVTEVVSTVMNNVIEKMGRTKSLDQVLKEDQFLAGQVYIVSEMVTELDHIQLPAHIEGFLLAISGK